MNQAGGIVKYWVPMGSGYLNYVRYLVYLQSGIHKATRQPAALSGKVHFLLTVALQPFVLKCPEPLQI
jgi:hypothetical protein